MKKIAFVVSHLGSGSFNLINILNKNPRCNFFNSKIQYSHPDDVRWMFNNAKLKNYSGSVFGDHLLYNNSFSCKSLYNYCKFIYVIRSPRFALNHIYKNYKLKNFASYYRFRLRRICEMAKNTPNFIFFTWEELANKSAIPILEKFLNVRLQKDENLFKMESEDILSEKIISETEDCYERYYYYLNNLRKLSYEQNTAK